jgi:hypothetical protein
MINAEQKHRFKSSIIHEINLDDPIRAQYKYQEGVQGRASMASDHRSSGRLGRDQKSRLSSITINSSIRTYGRDTELDTFANGLSMPTYNGGGPIPRPVEPAVNANETL